MVITCKEKPPIDERKFMFIYIDLISFPDSVQNQPQLIVSYRESVLMKHNVSKEDYVKTIEFYNSQPERWDEFFNKTIKYYESLNDSSIIK